MSKNFILPVALSDDEYANYKTLSFSDGQAFVIAKLLIKLAEQTANCFYSSSIFDLLSVDDQKAFTDLLDSIKKGNKLEKSQV